MTGTDGYQGDHSVAGQKLIANILTSAGKSVPYPVNKDATYKWYYEGSDAVLGIEAVYTVTSTNLDKGALR